MTTLLAPSIAAVAGLLIYAFTARRTAIDRKRTACAEALSDALAWLELPYRIARRTSDDPAMLQALAERVHHLHDRHLYHESWLRMELPTSCVPYRQLLAAVRDAAKPHMQQAWQDPPVGEATMMNRGPLTMPPVDKEVVEFTRSVRCELRWWQLWA